jgi:hypothetical protein
MLLVHSGTARAFTLIRTDDYPRWKSREVSSVQPVMRGATHCGAPPEGKRENGKTGSHTTDHEEEPGEGQGIQASGAKG